MHGHTSGPGSAIFSDPQSEDTAVSFDQEGLHEVTLTANDGIKTSHLTIQILVESGAVATGLVPDLAWLRFDETSGSTAENDVGPIDGALVSVNAQNAWTDGKFGGALDLSKENGIGHVVVAENGDYPLDPDQPWTIAFWVNVPAGDMQTEPFFSRD